MCQLSIIATYKTRRVAYRCLRSSRQPGGTQILQWKLGLGFMALILSHSCCILFMFTIVEDASGTASWQGLAQRCSEVRARGGSRT